MSYYIPRNLLTDNNVKTIKGEKVGWKTFILYMSPHKQNSLKVNICPNASPGCIAACLFSSGNGGMFSTIKAGRINKTEYFLHNQKDFMLQLVKELTKLSKKYAKLAIRLNGTSDIAWETIKINHNQNIFQMFKTIQFYDYTKSYERMIISQPKNYHLTFSRSEINEPLAMDLLARKKNVAMVFNNVPTTYMGYEVINGDENDLRFTNKNKVGKIIGLKYKRLTGKKANNKSGIKTGFVIKE